MKIVLNRSKFLESFNLAASGASNQVKDVLGNVLIDARHGYLESSNGETSISVYLDQKTDSDGTALLDPRRVGAILKESRSESVPSRLTKDRSRSQQTKALSRSRLATQASFHEYRPSRPKASRLALRAC